MSRTLGAMLNQQSNFGKTQRTGPRTKTFCHLMMKDETGRKLFSNVGEVYAGSTRSRALNMRLVVRTTHNGDVSRAWECDTVRYLTDFTQPAAWDRTHQKEPNVYGSFRYALSALEQGGRHEALAQLETIGVAVKDTHGWRTGPEFEHLCPLRAIKAVPIRGQPGYLVQAYLHTRTADGISRTAAQMAQCLSFSQQFYGIYVPAILGNFEHLLATEAREFLPSSGLDASKIFGELHPFTLLAGRSMLQAVTIFGAAERCIDYPKAQLILKNAKLEIDGEDEDGTVQYTVSGETYTTCAQQYTFMKSDTDVQIAFDPDVPAFYWNMVDQTITAVAAAELVQHLDALVK